MIRTKKDIDIEIKAGKADLEVAINDSIRAERSSEEYIASINKKLSELSSESCFEDTLEGRVKALEDKAFGKIKGILKFLSETTGKSYNLFPTAAFTCNLNGPASIEFQKVFDKAYRSSL